jgi:hypothetical protein
MMRYPRRLKKPEDGNSKLFRNAGIYYPVYTASDFRSIECSGFSRLAYLNAVLQASYLYTSYVI